MDWTQYVLIIVVLLCVGGISYMVGGHFKMKIEERRLEKSLKLYALEVQKLNDLRGVEMVQKGQSLIDKYGPESQVDIAVEQLAHLIESLMKLRRKNDKTSIVEICNRFWEVQFSINQLQLIIIRNIGAKDILDATYEKKNHQWGKR